MHDLEALLAEVRSEGQLHSEGVFTSSEKGALERLSQRLLPDPSMFMLKFVQAMVVSGAIEIRVSEKMGWVDIEADTPSRDPGLNLRDWVGQAWRDPVPERRYLPAALLGAWPHFSEIHLDWGDQRLLFRPPNPVPSRLETLELPFGQVRVAFKRKHWRLITGQQEHADRLFACPVPVREVPFGRALLQARAYRDQDQNPWWNEMLGAVGVGGEQARLVAPDSMAGACPVFFRERAPLPRYESSQKPDAFTGKWYPVERLYMLLSGDVPGAVIPVQAGVGLNPVQADLGVAGLRCVVAVETEGLQTDLGQLVVRRDEAFERLLTALREEAPGLMRHMHETLQAWKPNTKVGSAVGPTVGFFAGALVGFGLIATTGVPLPFHLLALPGAMLGSRWSATRWRQQTLERLRHKLGEPDG